MRAVAKPGSVVFEATLLHDGVVRNWLARTVMDRNNAHGVFSNAEDDLDGLRQVTSEQLEEPLIKVVGCVALFSRRMGTP